MIRRKFSAILQAIFLTALSTFQLFCVAHSAFAGTNEWTPLGPERGRIALLTMDPTNPQVLYASGENGGFKTTNGGASWTPIAYINLGVPTALTIDRNKPQVVYQTFVSQCDRVFKSSDGGASFHILRVGFSRIRARCPDGSITGLVVDPSDSQTLYAAGSVEGGIFKSTDGGINWPKMSNGLIGIPSFLVIDPNNPWTLYTGTFSDTEARGRIFKTIDGGASWASIDTGITRPLTTSPFALLIDPTNSQTLYVASYGGIFKSTDGGLKWEPLDVGLPTVFVAALAIDPKNPQVLYAAANDGVLKSTNGGSTWKQMGAGLPMTPWALAIDFHDPQVLYAGVYGEAGVYKSTDGGERWSAMNAGLTDVAITEVITDPDDSQIVYIAASPGGVGKSTEGGMDFASMNTGLPNPPFHLTIDLTDPQILYAVVPLVRKSVRANFPSDGVFKTTNGGEDWTSINTGLPESDPGDFFGVFAPVVIDPQNSQTLYVANYEKGLYKSTNGGEAWTPVHENEEEKLQRVLTVEIDPKNSQILYAGLDLAPPFNTPENGVLKSTNGGMDWSPINEGLPTNPNAGKIPSVFDLAIDPDNPQTVYAALRGVGGGLYKSTDGGESWGQTKGIPIQLGVHRIVMDPQHPQILYAGTDEIVPSEPGGVYKSIDGGENWASLNDGFPRVDGVGLGVFTLAIDYQNPNTLYAGTVKYGLFVLTQQ